MKKDQEIELFDHLSRTKLRDWLQHKIAVDFDVLTQATDIEQLRKAQGRVGLLQQMVKLLDAAPDAVKR